MCVCVSSRVVPPHSWGWATYHVQLNLLAFQGSLQCLTDGIGCVCVCMKHLHSFLCTIVKGLVCTYYSYRTVVRDLMGKAL